MAQAEVEARDFVEQKAGFCKKIARHASMFNVACAGALQCVG